MIRSIQLPTRCVCRCLQQMFPAGGTISATRNYQNPNTHVFERMHPVDNVEVGSYPYLKKRHYILKKIEMGASKYQSTIKCILTREVEGVGLKGSVVEVKKTMFRNHLYPQGDAVYASPENLVEYEQYRKNSPEEGITYEAKMIMKKLSGCHLSIFMNGDTDWELDATHIKVAFRLSGVSLSEDNIIMPDTPIMEPGEFVFQLQMLDRIRTQVRATIYPLVDGEPLDPDTEYPPLWDNEPIDPENPLEYINCTQSENVA